MIKRGPTLVLLRLLIFRWKLEQTYMCLVPKLIYQALPHSGAQQYCPHPPDMPLKPLEVEDPAMF